MEIEEESKRIKESKMSEISIAPYYTSSHVRLFLGDSLKIVKALKERGERFDLLITDPPYGLNQKNRPKSGVNGERAKATYEGEYFEDTQEYLRDVVRPIIDECLSICDLGIITGGVGSWGYLPKPNEEGCMFMPASPGFNTWAHQDYQPIYYYGRPKGNYGKYRKLSHLVTERGFSKNHPCSKPLEVWKKMMLCGTDGVEGKRILDPFGGSGTTGRAAQDLNMDATLIELNPTYCELIKSNCCQQTLF